MYPKLMIDLSKIEKNINVICSLLKGQRIAAVTKGIDSDDIIAELFFRNGITIFADSSIDNIKRLRRNYGKKIEVMFLRTPMEEEIEEAAENCDYFLVSCETKIDKIKNINKYAKIFLMIDKDDNREGVYYKDTETIIKLSKKTDGVAMTKGCLSGIAPNKDDLEIINEIGDKYFAGKDISIGGTYFSDVFNEVKDGNRNYIMRVGELFFTGKNPIGKNNEIEDLYKDAFIIRAEIIEIHIRKEIGADYRRKMAVIVLGNSYLNTSGLKLIDKNAAIIGNTSEHMIVDITKSETVYNIGDFVEFVPEYINYSTFFKNKSKNIEYFSTF